MECRKTLSRHHKGRFYVYIHATDCGEIYYVGKGSNLRAFVSSGRSAEWLRIREEKGLMIYASIPIGDEMESYANEIEIIEKLSDIGAFLINKSKGGDGSSLVKTTLATRNKQRQAKIGRKQSPEHAEKSRSHRVGHKNTPWHRERTAAPKRKPVVNSNGETFKSAAHAARYMNKSSSISGQGNITMCCQGKRNNAFGVSWAYLKNGKPNFLPTNYREKPLVCVDTGDKFDSALGAVEWIRQKRPTAVRQAISNAARNPGRRAYGYEWKYQ